MHLRPLPLAEAYALLAGRPSRSAAPRWHPDYPLEATYEALTLLTGGFEALGEPVPAEPQWWIHQLVLDGQVVGDAGFHGPPADGVVEIGYAVVPAWWGHGLATWACAAILEVAWRSGATVVRAEVEPDNLGSQTVLLRNGFTLTNPGSAETGLSDGGSADLGSADLGSAHLGSAGLGGGGPMRFEIGSPVSS